MSAQVKRRTQNAIVIPGERASRQKSPNALRGRQICRSAIPGNTNRANPRKIPKIKLAMCKDIINVATREMFVTID